MMNKVFVIMATQGEYSDRMEWPICVVSTEAKAQDRVMSLTEKEKVDSRGQPSYHETTFYSSEEVDYD